MKPRGGDAARNVEIKFDDGNRDCRLEMAMCAENYLGSNPLYMKEPTNKGSEAVNAKYYMKKPGAWGVLL